MVLRGAVATSRRVLPAAPDWPTTNNQIRGVILTQIEVTETGEASRLTEMLNSLNPEPGDLARARTRVLDLLDATDYKFAAQELVNTLNSLNPEPGDLARARTRVLDLLDAAEAGNASWLAKFVLHSLGPEPGDLARARARVLALLPTVLDTAEARDARSLAETLNALARARVTSLEPGPRILNLLRCYRGQGRSAYSGGTDHPAPGTG